MFNVKSKMKYLFLQSALWSRFEYISFVKLPFPVVLLNKSGKILFANNCFYSTFKNISKPTIYIASLFSEISQQYLNDNKNSQTDFFLDNKWFRIAKICAKQKVLLYFYDITQDKLLQDKRNTFVASLTHDLKTPISAQIRTLDLLLNGFFGNLTDEQAEITKEIKQSCNYMQQLIFNIVDTYLFEKGERKLIREKFDWTKLVGETVKELSYLLNEKKQTIKISADIDFCEIYADKFQMKRVITNLVSNAITYSNPNSEIEILMSENNDKIRFDVKNKSFATLPENSENIFNKYQTNLSSGSGLGLYIVKQIISSEGGNVYAQNTHDGKCVFGFETPKKINSVGQISNYLKK